MFISFFQGVELGGLPILINTHTYPYAGHRLWIHSGPPVAGTPIGWEKSSVGKQPDGVAVTFHSPQGQLHRSLVAEDGEDTGLVIHTFMGWLSHTI